MVESKSEDSDTTAKSAEVSLYVLSFDFILRYDPLKVSVLLL